MGGIYRKGMLGLVALLQFIWHGQAIPLNSDQSLPAGISQHLPLDITRRAAPTLNQSLPQQAIPLNISDDGTSCLACTRPCALF